MSIAISILLGASILLVFWLICHVVGCSLLRMIGVNDYDDAPSLVGVVAISIAIAVAVALYAVGSPLLQVLEHGWKNK